MIDNTDTHQANTDTVSTPPLSPLSDRSRFQRTDWALFATVGTIWGSSYLLIKIGLDTFHPGLITWARVLLGAATLRVANQRRPLVANEDRSKVWALSVIWVGVPFTLFPLAEQHISSAATGLLTGATPIFTGIFAALWFNRAPGSAQKLGMLTGFVGIILITAGSLHEGESAPLGLAMVLVATACYGLATNLAGPLQRTYGSVPLMARMLTLGAMWTAPFGMYGAVRSAVAFGPVIATVLLGVVGTGLAFALMASLVGRVGGPRASFITFVIPIVALGLGAMALGESVGATALLGTGLVLLATRLGSRSEGLPTGTKPYS